MKQQKLTLMKQRKDYVKKQASLRSDLEQLAKQKRELLSEKRADNEPIISKNYKLQVFLCCLKQSLTYGTRKSLQSIYTVILKVIIAMQGLC